MEDDKLTQRQYMKQKKRMELENNKEHYDLSRLKEPVSKAKVEIHSKDIVGGTDATQSE